MNKTMLGFWFVTAWTLKPRDKNDKFQEPWFNDMWPKEKDEAEK